MAQRKNTQDRIRFSLGTEQEENQSISESLSPEVQLGGGVYRSTLPTYSDGDNAIFHFNENGELKVDTELTVDGVTIDNIDIQDISAGTQTNDVIVTMDGEVVDTQIATVEDTIPTELTDGTKTDLWVDTFKRQVIAGFSQAVNSLNVSEQAPAQLMTLEQTNLDAVTSTGAGSDIDVSNYNKITVAYTASSVSTGGTVKLEGSMDGTNYYDIDSESISSDGTTYHSVSGEKHKYIRTNLSSRTDGTYTTKIFCGN